ncbi:group II intron reverse transcriptase/maturase [Lentzea aerocolonigenes]|uniref:group II intron reverse transcriptase/maturase n=4 Tax=Lentzea aerocolonigenes TaxID=68170 RepID=UPI0004C3DCC6|nr:group II intron reverse transcriptase/maturase [Lentzea aerocolonigenes]MCP2251264.1 RNA-directed DNA polymerase [Lentzea aerocolonigenes]
MNTREPDELTLLRAERRVLEIQAKLHRWAAEEPGRRFDDLFNLVVDPAFVLVAWERVRGNKGARTAGADGVTVACIRDGQGVEVFLDALRSQVKGGGFRPVAVRERMIPKPGGRLRRLGIPTVADRVVQASLKLVLEPIFEAGFQPCSYGFRPNRRVQDAVAETRYLASRSYEWVVEGDIEACFDTIDHAALMDRVRVRVGDKRVLALVKAFLKAGILSQDGAVRDTCAGTPQGGILSPLLANIALSVLDDYVAQAAGGPATPGWQRTIRRRRGQANYRLVRYADDFLVLVSGSREHAEQLREVVAEVLAPMGLCLSASKTMITHIDEGFDFLGWRIQRHRQKGSDRRYIYTYPSRQSLKAIMGKVKKLCRQDINRPLPVLLSRLNPALRGWCAYFQPGVSSSTFHWLSHLTWRQVIGWIRRKHRRITWKQLRRRYCGGGWWPITARGRLFEPGRVSTTRYRYRGARIPTPWAAIG